jgi:hypothetical protein
MDIDEALQQLIMRGHKVETEPVITHDGVTCYRIDGALKIQQHILDHLMSGGA